MHRLGSWAAILFSSFVLVVSAGLPAAAHHTDPRTPLAPTNGSPTEGIERGDGDWTHIDNFPGGANNALTGGGTDLEFFSPAGSDDVFGAFGTLGQDDVGSIGQRIIQLTQNGRVLPRWVADHGSAHCTTDNTSVTGLQHDSQISQSRGVTLLTDTTDATGRCHDPEGGGIEIVDVTDIDDPTFAPREVHLVRFAGFSHTHTADPDRPGIVYNSSSDFDGRNWIDVMDMRSCFGSTRWSLERRQQECRPQVYRIPFRPEWTQQRDQNTGQLEPGSAACHDITYADDRLYCAALNATVILDVSNLVNARGDVGGTPLQCSTVPGTRTDAMVTDCDDAQSDPAPQATGWRFVGTYQHPGRDCGPPGTDVRNCNSNNQVRSDDGVSVSHEADPSHDRQFMFVTDERGGGVVPPGSSCAPGIENPFGNGGAHAFDISDPSDITYATTPQGRKSVYISDAVVPAETFCDIHVMELVPDEQRFIAAYYSQGVKIVDYFVDGNGNLQFQERASFTLPNANTWSAEAFKIQENADGTRTYFIAADDIHRGIDVMSWTGRPNTVGTQAPPAGAGTAMMNTGLVGFSVLALGAAAAYRRRSRVEVLSPGERAQGGGEH